MTGDGQRRAKEADASAESADTLLNSFTVEIMDSWDSEESVSALAARAADDEWGEVGREFSSVLPHLCVSRLRAQTALDEIITLIQP